MNYKKKERKKALGDEFNSEDLIDSDIESLSIKDFIKKYKLDLQPETIRYHMKTNKIDWTKPARDCFVLVTEITLNFYNL